MKMLMDHQDAMMQMMTHQNPGPSSVEQSPSVAESGHSCCPERGRTTTIWWHADNIHDRQRKPCSPLSHSKRLRSRYGLAMQSRRQACNACCRQQQSHICKYRRVDSPRRKHKVQRQKVVRQRKKVEHLQTVIDSLEDEHMISKNSAEVLQATLSRVTNELMQRMLNGTNNKGTSTVMNWRHLPWHSNFIPRRHITLWDI